MYVGKFRTILFRMNYACKSNWLNLICYSYLEIVSFNPLGFYQPSSSQFCVLWFGRMQ